jgi:hypothetical protein
MEPSGAFQKLRWSHPGIFLMFFSILLITGLLSLRSALLPAMAAPTTPQPILPADGDSVITPTFSWLPSSGAVKYMVQVGLQSDPANVLKQYTTLNLNLTPVDSIDLPNAPLYWRVGGCLNASDTLPESWSSKVNFTKYIPAPEVTSPPNHVALTEPVFGWGPVAGAASYKVDVTHDETFNTIDYTYTTYNAHLTPTSALTHGVFYWRVRGVDAGGNDGANSVVHTFVKYMHAPLTTAPHNGDTLTTPTLEWEETSGAASYRIEVSTDSTFNQATSYTTYETRLTPNATLANGAFYWRVRGVDAGGHEGEPSLPQTFQKIIPSAQLISPADGVTVTMPSLEWQPVVGAAYYKVEISAAALFNAVTAYTTYNTRLIPLQTQPAGTSYWRVTGLDADGHAGATSPARSFYLTTASATSNTTLQLLSPAEGEILTSDPTFRWTLVAGAASYSLKIYKDNALNTVYDSISTKYTGYTPYQAGLKNAYADNTPATPSYYWKVEARNSSGVILAASDPGSFAKQMPLPLSQPADQESPASDPTFVWTQVEGAKTYTIQISINPAVWSSLYDTVSTRYTSYNPYLVGLKNIYANGTYYWRVRANSSSGETLTTSTARSFTKQTTLHLKSPDNSAVLLADPEFAWDSVRGAAYYHLIVSDSPSNWSPAYDTRSTEYTSYAPYTGGLINEYINGTYYWKVEAYSSSGQIITTSQVYQFTKATSLQLLNPAQDASMGSSPTFRWEAVVGAKTYRLIVSTSPVNWTPAYDVVTTDYTTYVPYAPPGLKKNYTNGTYYWKVEARTSNNNTIATSLTSSFSVDTSLATSTPIGAPSLTPSLTSSPRPPTLTPAVDGAVPTEVGPRETAGPPPISSKSLGIVTVFADTFTDLGEERWQASGHVRLGGAAAAYVTLGTGEAILDYSTQNIEGLSGSLVSLLLDDDTLATVFAGPFTVNPGTGNISTPFNTVFQLTSLGDLGVDTGTPLVDFSMNVVEGAVSGKARIIVYPIEGNFPSALVDFSLDHTGEVSGGLGVGDLEFEAAGVTFSVESATLSYAPTSGGKITISSATIRLPDAFDLGAEGSVEDLVITVDGLESVGGGSITLELPEMAIPGTDGSMTLAGAQVSLYLNAEGDYYINGQADFSAPNISSKGSPDKTYNGSLYAEFQLDQDGLVYVLMKGEIDPGIPIGQSGFVLSSLEGKVTLSPVVRVQITGTLQTEVEVPPLGPLVSGEPTVWVQLSEPYEIGISGSVKVLIFDAAQASLILSQETGMTGSVHVNYIPYMMEGDARLHVWREGGEFHFTGSAGVTIGFHKGALGSYFGIDLPPSDFTFANLGTEFGEFCNDRYCASTIYGFKGAVDITLHLTCPRVGWPPYESCSYNLFSYAFFIDLDGNLDYGSSLDQYQLVDQAAYLAQRRASGLETVDTVASMNVMTFSMATTDLALVGLEWKTGMPTLSLVDPNGITVTRYVTSTTPYPGMAFTDTITSTAYAIQNPLQGTWRAVINDLTGSEDYTFRALGRNLPPVISFNHVALTPYQTSAHQAETYEIKWNAYDADPGTNLALYYDSDNSGADGTLITEGLDPAAGSYVWDPSQVKTGTYYLYARIDDLKNLPVTQYYTDTIKVINHQAPAAPTGVEGRAPTPGKYLRVCWNISPEKDVTGYHVYFGSQPGFYDLGVFNATNLPCTDLIVPVWVNAGYAAVAAYDNSGNESPLSVEVKVAIHREDIYLPLVKR